MTKPGTKTWKLVITELGGSEALSEAAIVAANWMTALKLGRESMGESGGVPTGASCAVAADGRVTVHDPIARKSYVLVPGAATETGADKSAQSIEPLPRPRPNTQTIAYSVPSPGALQAAHDAAAAQVPPNVAPGRGPSDASVEIAGQESADDTAELPAIVIDANHGGADDTSEVAAVIVDPSLGAVSDTAEMPAVIVDPSLGAVSDTAEMPAVIVDPSLGTTSDTADLPAVMVDPSLGATSDTSEPAAVVEESSRSMADDRSGLSPVVLDPNVGTEGATSAVAEAADAANLPLGLSLLGQRNEDPTPESPLHYRERTYVAPSGTTKTEAEGLLRDCFESLGRELADTPPGKFFNLALFDHRWTGRPERPPIATLQWKDWRGEPIVEFPQNSPPARPLSFIPPARRDPTDEHNARLAKAFEASQDLLFLTTPVEALEFSVRLLKDLVPSEAASALLYDIDTDEFRFVALEGPGADERKSEAIPTGTGLLGAAAQTGRALRVGQASSDDRFDPGVDGRVGVEPESLLYLRLSDEGRLLGMLQLINSLKRDTFTEADAEVVTYVGTQLSRFLHKARIAPPTVPPLA